MAEPSVLFVQPPYLRLFGSHNNRVPLELHYLDTWLKAEIPEIDSQVLNLDKTDATSYITWRDLFKNSHYIKAFLSQESPLLGESLERILSLDPQIVVLSAADGLTPWVDVGNPYSTAILSQHLRRMGIYTVGIGPFLTRAAERFTTSFDALLQGPASPTIVEIITERRTGVVRGRAPYLDIPPRFGEMDSLDIANVVMTSIGCPHGCTFCLGARTGYAPIDTDAINQDIRGRAPGVLEIGDAILPMNVQRLDTLVDVLSATRREFSCEISMQRCTPDTLNKLWDAGVRHLKMGIETAYAPTALAFKKPRMAQGIADIVHRCKEKGFRLTGYILLGGPDARNSASRTLTLCKELELDNLVINVLSHFDLQKRDFSEDCHWSLSLAHHWGVEGFLEDFFELQSRSKDKEVLGKLFDLPSGVST